MRIQSASRIVWLQLMVWSFGMRSRILGIKKPIPRWASRREFMRRQRRDDKKDGGLLPHEFLAYIAQIGIIGGEYVVPPSLRIKCARIAAPYFSDRLVSPRASRPKSRT